MKYKIAKLGYLNIFRKLFVFWKYLMDNIHNKQFSLIKISIKYLLFKKSNSKNKIVCTNLGKFLIRKGTRDFKLVNSAYEYFVIKIFRKEILKADLFIDVGANIGTYSIIASKAGISTIAFEPIPDNFNSLINNIELNNFASLIKPYKFGLGSDDSIVQFNFNPAKPGASGINVVNKYHQIIKVDIKKFDNLLIDEIRTVKKALVKIDVEGMELDVLNGMKEFIKLTKHLTFIIESKHIGDDKIKTLLNSIAPFNFFEIDGFNILANKTI